MKIEKKVDKVCDLCEELIDCIKQEFASGIQNVDTKEAGEVIDMVKDLAESEEKMVKAIYYTEILKAMAESEYGVDYNQNGKMYYTEPREVRNPNEMMNHGMDNMPMQTTGRYDKMRRNYVESKEMHKGTSENMQKLEKYMDSIEDDIDELSGKMTDVEKEMTRNKLVKLANKMN